MPSRPPSVASQSSTTKARDEGRALALCGQGNLADDIDARLLKMELEQFYEEHTSAGEIALRRAHTALKTLSRFGQLPQRIRKSATRKIRPILREELTFAIKYNHPDSVKPLFDLVEGMYIGNHIEMHSVRSLITSGWPRNMPTFDGRFKLARLGPLQWWLVIDRFNDEAPLRREAIYNRALKHLLAARAARTATGRGHNSVGGTSESQTTSQARPISQAAGATNTARLP